MQIKFANCFLTFSQLRIYDNSHRLNFAPLKRYGKLKLHPISCLEEVVITDYDQDTVFLSRY